MTTEFWIQGEDGRFEGSKPGVPKRGSGRSQAGVESRRPSQLEQAKDEFWDWASRQNGLNIQGDSPLKDKAEEAATDVRTGRMDLEQAYEALAKGRGSVSAYRNATKLIENDMAFWNYYRTVGGSKLADDMLTRFARGAVPGATDFVMKLNDVSDAGQQDVAASEADKTIEEAKKEDPGYVDRVMKVISQISMSDIREALKNPEVLKALTDMILDLIPYTGFPKGVIEAIIGSSMVAGTPLEFWERIVGAIPVLGALGKFKILGKIAIIAQVKVGANAKIAKEVALRTKNAEETLKGLEDTLKEAKALSGNRETNEAKKALLFKAEREINGVVNDVDNSLSLLEKQVGDIIKGSRSETISEIKSSYDILKQKVDSLARIVGMNKELTISKDVKKVYVTLSERLKLVEANLKTQGIIP